MTPSARLGRGKNSDVPLHPRGADHTREAIRVAARDLFAERGYPGTTVRDVAARAGISQGLITRYFGSKENLFLAVTSTSLNLAEVVIGPADGLGGRMADSLVARWQRTGSDDPLLILMRAAASRPEAAAALTRFLHREAHQPLLAALLGYGCSEAEAADVTAAVQAFIMGAVMSERVLHLRRTASSAQHASTTPPGQGGLADPDGLQRWLATSIHNLVTRSIPGPARPGPTG